MVVVVATFVVVDAAVAAAVASAADPVVSVVDVVAAVVVAVEFVGVCRSVDAYNTLFAAVVVVVSMLALLSYVASLPFITCLLV